jgi:chromosome segregation ATPase
MATQTATAPLNSVEDLNQQLGHLWAERRRIEKELESVTLGIQTADENARSLKKRLVQGDAGASSLLDKTEADRKELARKDEGLRLSLQELEPKINAAQQALTTARQSREEQEQEQRFREACDKAAADVERLIELHAQTCKKLADVRQAQQHLNDRFGHRGASAVERIVLGPLANLIHQLQTKSWTYPRGVFLGGATIEIRPLLPPPAHMNGNGSRKS